MVKTSFQMNSSKIVIQPLRYYQVRNNKPSLKFVIITGISLLIFFLLEAHQYSAFLNLAITLSIITICRDFISNLQRVTSKGPNKRRIKHAKFYETLKQLNKKGCYSKHEKSVNYSGFGL